MAKEYIDILTPSLLELGTQIQETVKNGYEIDSGPNQDGWQYEARLVRDTEKKRAGRPAGTTKDQLEAAYSKPKA